MTKGTYKLYLLNLTIFLIWFNHMMHGHKSIGKSNKLIKYVSSHVTVHL